MLTYSPAAAVAHRLDPRSKLAFQVGFAAAAFAHTTPVGLLALTPVAAFALAAARLPPLRVLRAYRYLLPFLGAAPVLAATTLGPPWVRPAAAVDPLLAAGRVLLVAAVAAAYVRSTPVRESRAAIEWALPGKPGRLLGAGVGLTLRFLPLLRRDLRVVRDAEAARLGERRPVRDRMRTIAAAGISRAFDRADGLALALRARCFAWNPTLPRLSFGRLDWPVLAAAALLAASAI